MDYITEWFNLLATFFLYIPTLLGVIFGVTITLALISRNRVKKWMFTIIAASCVLVFSQVNSAFTKVIMDMLMNIESTKTTSI